jgi:hypothetical protein
MSQAIAYHNETREAETTAITLGGYPDRHQSVGSFLSAPADGGRSHCGRGREASLGTALPPLEEVFPGWVYPHGRAP